MRKIAELDIYSLIYSSSKDHTKEKGCAIMENPRWEGEMLKRQVLKIACLKKRLKEKYWFFFSGVIEISKEIKSLELKYLHVFKPMFES